RRRVVALHVPDRHRHDLALLVEARERRVRAVDAQAHVAADVAQAPVDADGSGQEAGLEKDLEAVADAEERPAPAGERRHALHDGREPRERPGAQVVAVREPARQDEDVRALEVAVAVPDVLGFAAEEVFGDVEAVLVAVGAREDEDPELHDTTLTSNPSMTVLARSSSAVFRAS